MSRELAIKNGGDEQALKITH